MLKQRGCYTLKLSDGNEINLRFCTWTLKRFSEINGDLTFDQLQEWLLTDMSLSKFISLIKCAAEYVAVKEGSTFTYTDMDVSDWIDDIGGLSSPAFVAMVESLRASFADGDQNGQEKKRTAKV